MSTQAVNRTERIFRAKMNDGSNLLYKSNYQGYVTIDTTEHGRPSTWDHPFDDRRCNWNIQGRIQRRVAVVVTGQEYWNDNLTQVFSQSHTGQGSSFVLTGLQSENCNSSAPRRDSDHSNMVNSINDSLELVADNDVQSVLASIKGLPGVVEVNV